MDAKQQKQEELIRFLVQDRAKCKREQLVFDKFVQELKDEGRVGIPDQLHKIRNSHEIQAAYAATFASLDAIVSSVLEEMTLDQVEKAIRNLKPEIGEPN